MSAYLAFDYGLRRIGAAVGVQVTRSARPLPAIANTTQPDWKAIERLIAEWRPLALIVGLPLDEGGADQAISQAARHFSRQLEQKTGLPVHLVDERFSSRAADDAVRDARASGQMVRRVRKGDRDGQAARIILEQWLADHV